MVTYNKVTPEIAGQIRTVVGEKRFFMGESVNSDYSHDEMPIYGKHLPEAVCEVETTEEVSAIMKICSANKIPVTPRGAGTGLVGGAVPLIGGLIICTSRMNKILGYDMNNFAVTAQPGVLLGDLSADALEHGLMYPPDPSEKTASIGGNVSTNASGMRAVKYGVTRDYVLAMTVVLPSGEILKLGKTVGKTSSGYSLMHLFIGSEGTLGIITELTLKLVPKPQVDVSFILPFADMESCIASVPVIRKANLDPQSIDFMDTDMIKFSSAFTGNPVFPVESGGEPIGACILITFAANMEEELDLKMEKIAELAEEVGAMDVLVVDTPTLKKDIWAAHAAFITSVESASKHRDEMDTVIPLEHIPDYLNFVRETGAELGLSVHFFGHAGDGNLHIFACSDDLAEADFIKHAGIFMDKAYAKCMEFGGYVSGEHAIGHAKKKYLKESVGDTAYSLMASIKKVFDPDMILNPGKVCTEV